MRTVYNDPLDFPLDTRSENALAQLNAKGFVIIPDFYTREKCIQIIAGIEEILKKYKEKIWVDAYEADHRIFGADNLSQTINAFYHEELINQIIYKYEGSSNRQGFVMAAKLKAAPKNLGSGQGWHRDSPSFKQTKAILYLTDTGIENGPFQYIEGSHKPLSVLYSQFRYRLKFNESRFTDDEIDRIIKDKPSSLHTITGAAGTLIIADTRGIHRGAPIINGTRYALTDYLWFNSDIPAHIKPLVIYNES